MRHIALIVFLMVAAGWAPGTAVLGQIAEKKAVEAGGTTHPPRIDGILDEAAWSGVGPATGFIKRKPFNGNPATHETVVKFLYDDEALYVGAMMHDPSPDSIFTELSERDRENMADWFGIYIDCFNDYLNAFGFMVTAAGVQIDLRHSGGDSDKSWDAVWESATMILDSGWTAEYRIPYSALRFPRKPVQLWGLQAFRNITRYREESTWNFVDLEEEGLNNQAGELHGIREISPPLRLSLVPYLSAYTQKNPGTDKWGYSYNYGLDLKVGLNESYTLDMTLIPDFGQVQSDDEIYNLSPFEVYYDERRPFFMEGTELFQKGNVFYTRRVGKTPAGYGSVSDSLAEHEVITENPQYAQLINATKISGKSSKNLAVGIFNGMTANTWAEVQDTLSGEKRRIRTEPLTNYNMVVFDQALRNNSYVSFYNTNVFRPQSRTSANVTGSELRITSRDNAFALWGKGIASQNYGAGTAPEFGYLYSMAAGKISGNFTFELSQDVIDDRYDPNEMGFLRHNNIFSQYLRTSYNRYRPFWILLDSYNSFWMNYTQLYRPRVFSDFKMGFRSRNTFRNFLTLWVNGELAPAENHDYYEPRVEGLYFARPPEYAFSLGISPDYKKRFLIDWNLGYSWAAMYDSESWSISAKPRFRASDKLMIIFNARYIHDTNDPGYVTDSIGPADKPVVIFGSRDIDTYENTLDADYKFTNRSSLGFRLRHYWIAVKYGQFFNLAMDGSLSGTDYQGLHDFSFNAFNIDMQYIWNFAPGSELRIVWKNAISTYEEAQLIDEVYRRPEEGFGRNLLNVIQSPATNSFSVKVLYYIDYARIRKAIARA